MSKHTEGPWHKFYQPTQSQIEIMGASGWVVAYLRCGVAGTYETQEANAHLIAAAPDLLEALEAVVDMGIEDRPEVWGQAFAAIAKAKGETSD